MNDLRQTLICDICHGLLSSATTLQCSHSFCEPCITYYFKINVQTNNCCPTCQQQFQLDQIYKNSALQKVVNVYRQYYENSLRISQGKLQFTDEFSEKCIQTYFKAGGDSNANIDQQNKCENVIVNPNTKLADEDRTQSLISQPKFENIVDIASQATETLDEQQNNKNNDDSVSELNDSQQSFSELFDQFNRPVVKCQVCQRYIMHSLFNSHKQQCSTANKSNFGIASMRAKKLTKINNESKKKQMKQEDEIQKKQQKQKSQVKKFTQVTLVSNIKKIKTDLVEFGFKKDLVNKLQKPKLVDIYNKFVVKLENYRDFNKDINGLKLMICNEILQDIEDYNIDKREYFKLCSKMLMDDLLPQQSKEVLLKIRGFVQKSKEEREKYVDIE